MTGAEAFIGSYIARKVLDKSILAVSAAIKGYQSQLETSATDLEASLQTHLVAATNWSAESGVADSATIRMTQKVFVSLDCFVIPRSLRISGSESPKRMKMEELFSSTNQHLIFLGTPGAGKTTSMKHLCNRVLSNNDAFKGAVNYPLVVKLRDLSGSTGRNPLVMEIASTLGISISVHESIKGRSLESQKLRILLWQDAVSAFLNETRALLILDGFDEITEPERRRIVLEEVRALAVRLQTATLVMTSRTGEFVQTIDNTRIFEICPLNQNQIETFANRWIRKKADSRRFLDQVSKSPFGDAAMKPLNLAHLCALFERIGSIPEKPKTVYRKILRLLLEEWDEQRSVRRTSIYSKFEPDRKYDFLSSLAFHLTAERKRVTFGSQTLVSIYKEICRNFSLPIEEAKEVAQEIESHTGLLLKCGYDEYEFAHKSLQEFLAAEFIVRLPAVPTDPNIISRLPNELGISVTISSSSSLYFTDLVLGSLKECSQSLVPTFFSTFISRLVQEKPDFDYQDGVIIALIVLYSLTLNAFSEKGAQMPLFLVDPMLTDYENLVSLAISVDPKITLLDHYSYERDAAVISEFDVVCLRKNKNFRHYNLPDQVFVRKHFWESMSSLES